MENISEMIKRMCPKGVEYIHLKSVCSFKRGKTITVKDTVEGNIPVIAGGQKPSYYHNEANRHGESIVVAGSGAYAGFVSYWDKPIYVSDAFTVEPQDCLTHKYLYNYLKQNQQKIFDTQKGAGVPHVHGKDIENFEIPLPPLSIQQEIVRILDSFTSMITNLETELASRQKQYEYYRNKLLTFDKDDKNVEWKTLGEIVAKDCTVSYGIVQPGDGIANGVPVVRPIDLVNTIVHNINLKNTTKEISNAYKRTILKGGELLLCVRGTTGVLSIADDDLCGCNVTRGIVPLWFDKGISKAYAFHIIKSTSIQDEIERNTKGAGLRQINIKDLKLIKIPVPNRKLQDEIVEKLDTFESLITNLKQEIAARKKQYEYYREQLLTF